ncbi:uncharacterized protein LOC143694800 isoform X1 [Agelaius phoeniceus]|uniref:uncharacterized protein LOC143694800 isoform X1 n=1 Tax=Agelaius phoeniceus TaxID=39638 RepID=UPI004055084F
MKKTENWRRVGANKETDATENFFGDIKLLLTDCLSSSQGFQREAPPGASWPFGAGLGSAKGKSQKGQEEPASGRSRQFSSSVVRLCKLWVWSGGSPRSLFAHKIPGGYKDSVPVLESHSSPGWPRARWPRASHRLHLDDGRHDLHQGWTIHQMHGKQGWKGVPNTSTTARSWLCSSETT